MHAYLKAFSILIFIIVAFVGCKKSACEECIKTIGGFAGNIEIERKTVCNDNEIKDLENSSSGTTVWDCN
jgi:hypothetical protein